MFGRPDGACAIERNDPCGNWSRPSNGDNGGGFMKPDFDGPARRAFAAVNATQEHLAGLAPNAVVVATRKIAVNQIPHCNASSNM